MSIARVITRLKREEGWSATPYQDHLGFWTIGWGFLIDPRKNATLPQRVADYWLETLVEDRQRALDDALPWLLRQPDEVRDALTEMAYQMGTVGVLKFTKMLDALKAGNRVLASNEALDSEWARQTPERARRVAALIRGD